MFEDGNVLSGIPFGAVIGVSREFPDVDLLGSLTPEGQAMVAAAADMTVEQLVMSFPFLRWSDYLTVPSVLDIPGTARRLGGEPARSGHAHGRDVPVPRRARQVPRPSPTSTRSSRTYRREGADVTYRRLRFGEHVIVALAGAPGALRFLSERFATP